MIRVAKSNDSPPSLLVENCTKYNGQDVEKTLYSDQYGKCYLCEQNTLNYYQIEHFKAKAAGFFPDLKYTWSNLFLSCSYCNGRKPNNYDILDPCNNNVEDIVYHKLDLRAKSVVFSSFNADVQGSYTVSLLDRLFNGKNKLRDRKAEVLYENLQREMIFFLGILLEYKTTPTPENKQKIIDSLLITKEFLAFKYWLVKDNNLYNDFQEHMTWNRPVV